MKEQITEILTILKTGQIGKLFRGKTNNSLIQFFRYLFVGGIATVVDWGVSTLLFTVVFSQRFAVGANVSGFVFGLIVNYLMSTFWVFDSSQVKSRVKEFIAFAAIGLVGLVMTVIITWLFKLWLADVTSAYQFIGKVVSTAAAFLWNFFARKILLYSGKKSTEAD